MVRTFEYVPYPYLLRVNADGFLNRDITASLDSVGIYWGSPITVDETATAELDVFPILQSSADSWTSDDLARVTYVDYEVPAEGTEPHLLAVALNGQFASHFAGRPAPGSAPPPAAEPDDDAAAENAPGPSRVPLEESPETRLVLIGNAEFLSDFVARSIGQLEGGFFVENLRFVENLIDWATLDNEMIGIRSRGLVSRRLEPVDKGTEIVIESVNYLIPTVILLVVAVMLYWKRRNEPPMFETGMEPGRPDGLSAKRSQT
jgi:ABC-2 type transport system permease protein